LAATDSAEQVAVATAAAAAPLAAAAPVAEVMAAGCSVRAESRGPGSFRRAGVPRRRWA